MNFDKPLFSIITICYNEEKRINGTLKSIYSQTYSNFEHIVEDGKSSDRTLEIVTGASEHYSNGQLRVFSEEDNGLYDAMNRAIARAEGEYLCFINSGDYLYDVNTLQHIADNIATFPKMDWYYGDCIVTFPNGDEFLQIPTTIENIEGRDMTEYLKNNLLNLNHQSVFANRSCFEDNLFDTSLKLRAEVKWYYRCLVERMKIHKMDFPVCIYTYGGLSERSESLGIHSREMRSILNEFDMLSERILHSLPREDDYVRCYANVYNMWLALHQADCSLAKYLEQIGVKHIAIYGYAELGAHLINELKKSNIKIECLIERQRRNAYSGIEVIHPEEFKREVDLIIVTAIVHYKEVREYMKKRVDCKIVSLEQIIEDAWEYIRNQKNIYKVSK